MERDQRGVGLESVKTNAQMIPFIDIHTHKYSNNWSILNVDQRNDFMVESDPISIGIHPWFLTKANFKKDLRNLENLVDQVTAIGECGLDKLCETDWFLQKEAFLSQILVSKKYQKPLIIHCVKAYSEIIKIKQDFQPKMPWIIHGFNKKLILLETLIKNGFYISLGKKLIQNENWAKEISKVIPLEKLFFETDDSGVSIDAVYLTYAEVCKMDIDVLKKQIFSNYKKVFLGK